MRFLLAAFFSVTVLLALRPDAAAAQTTVTADWTALGKGNLSAVSDGTVLNVGANTVTINTAVVTDGDANDANFVPRYSTEMLSYYTGQVGANTGVLFYSTDHSVFDAGDYFQSTYTLNTAVTNLRFTVSNVDRFLNNPFFHDGVVIEYDTGSGTWQNLRSLTSAYTLGSAVGTTSINGQQAFHGINYSGGITSTTGNIAVNFASTTIKRVRIRYMFGQQNPTANPSGDWQYMGLSDFTWTQTGVTTSDLSMLKTVSNATPTAGAPVSFTLRLSNAGPASASNVTVRDILPTGFNLTGTSGYGTYNASTGIWTVPVVASDSFREITLSGTAISPGGVPVTNAAYVLSSANYDPDSVPGNTVTTEDDYSSATFTVVGTRTAGTPPVLSCARGSTIFDWDAPIYNWAAGSVSNSYNVANIGTVDFDIATSGTWVNDPAFGGLSPALSTANTGGLATAQNSLHQYLDFSDEFQTATTTIALSTAVSGAQFTVFDIDFAANDFADKLTVLGSYQGSSVTPVLTNGVSNYVVGNTAVGDSASGGTSGNGNVVVTFNQPVDTITMTYGNANTAPADPDGQAIALHDITFCNPFTDLSVSKISSIVSDPVNGANDPYAVPGAEVEYLITVANTGLSPADGGTVVITDDGPDNAKMCFDTNDSGQPVIFTDGSPTSGLSVNYVAFDNAGDDLEFSGDDGATWNYEPVLDGENCDTGITDFRLTPTGQFRAGSSFTLRTSYIIE